MNNLNENEGDGNLRCEANICYLQRITLSHQFNF